LLRKTDIAEKNQDGEMRWKDGYKPNPERKWEPVADGKHIWCFCKVDVGTFDYDEKNKDGTTKDPSKMK